MKIQYKPCPFCGSENIGYMCQPAWEFTFAYITCCGDCGARTGYHEKPRDAIDAWNMRAEGEKDDAEIH